MYTIKGIDVNMNVSIHTLENVSYFEAVNFFECLFSDNCDYEMLVLGWLLDSENNPICFMSLDSQKIEL